MKKVFFILFILISIFSFSQEKRNCGTQNRLELYRKSHLKNIAKSNILEEKIQKWIKDNANSKISAITIPVVVHIVYKNNTENISDAQIQSQIDVLNEDFSRTNQDASNTPFDFLPDPYNLPYLHNPKILFANLHNPCKVVFQRIFPSPCLLDSMFLLE